MLKKVMVVFLLITVVLSFGGVFVQSACAQDEAETADAAPDMKLDKDAADAESKDSGGKQGFFYVVASGGFVGIILWLALGASSVAGVALSVDSFITIREKKISPEDLVDEVRTAMEQGDVMKALKHCEEEPGPLANILSAGFSNVQEGFEAIQESVGISADQESEKLMQRVTYLNLVGNIAPMLGLLGTVQGMIYAFATLATQSAGAAQQSALAMNISQALYTTAAGLLIAVPAVAAYSFFKNKAMNIILNMEALTMDLIKALRNVEVVEE